MNFGLSDHNPRPGCILYSILSLSLLTTDTADTSLLMVTVKRLHIFDLKCLHVEVIQPQNGNRILNLKSQHEGFQEICGLLDGSDVLGEVAGPELHSSPLGVHSHLQLHVLNQGFQNAVPIGL